MMTTGTTMLMMVAANRSRPLVRPSREIHQDEESDTNALPGPGVYWDTNVLIRLKGDPGINGSRSEKHTISAASDGEGHERSDTLTDQDAESSAEHNDHEDSALFPKDFQLKSNKHYLDGGEETSAYYNSFFHKQLDTSGKELTKQKDTSLNSDGYSSYDTNLTSISIDPYYIKYYQGNNDYKSKAGGTPGWDYYDEYDSTQYTSALVTAEPSDVGYVSDKYELGLYYITKLRDYTWRIVTSVYQQLRSSLTVVRCSELVVCEAHRVGRAWGISGTLLASGLR
jgi:hypothetical protein